MFEEHEKQIKNCFQRILSPIASSHNNYVSALQGFDFNFESVFQDEKQLKPVVDFLDNSYNPFGLDELSQIIKAAIQELQISSSSGQAETLEAAFFKHLISKWAVHSNSETKAEIKELIMGDYYAQNSYVHTSELTYQGSLDSSRNEQAKVGVITEAIKKGKEKDEDFSLSEGLLDKSKVRNTSSDPFEGEFLFIAQKKRLKQVKTKSKIFPRIFEEGKFGQGIKFDITVTNEIKNHLKRYKEYVDKNFHGLWYFKLRETVISHLLEKKGDSYEPSDVLSEWLNEVLGAGALEELQSHFKGDEDKDEHFVIDTLLRAYINFLTTSYGIEYMCPKDSEGLGIPKYSIALNYISKLNSIATMRNRLDVLARPIFSDVEKRREYAKNNSQLFEYYSLSFILPLCETILTDLKPELAEIRPELRERSEEGVFEKIYFSVRDLRELIEEKLLEPKELGIIQDDASPREVTSQVTAKQSLDQQIKEKKAELIREIPDYLKYEEAPFAGFLLFVLSLAAEVDLYKKTLNHWNPKFFLSRKELALKRIHKDFSQANTLIKKETEAEEDPKTPVITRAS